MRTAPVESLPMATSRSTAERGRLVAATLAAALCALASAAVAAGATSLPPIPREQGERQTPLTRETRQALYALLDRFVPAAVERRDPAAAWDLATPSLRAGDGRRVWARGELPVPPYDAAGSRFHEWVLRYSFRTEVDVQLILLPSKRNPLGAMAFDVAFKRVHGRWLVDAFMPEASFARDDEPARMFSVRDVNPDSPANGTVSRHDKPRLGSVWFVVPAGLLLLPVAAFAAWALREGRWNRRAREATADSTLPDLRALGRRSG